MAYLPCLAAVQPNPRLTHLLSYECVTRFTSSSRGRVAWPLQFAASDWKIDDVFDAGGGRRNRIKTIVRVEKDRGMLGGIIVAIKVLAAE
jgi:hypothetical protein